MSMIGILGVFTLFFGTLMVNAASFTNAAASFSAEFDDLLYIIVEISFLCLLFFMTYIAIRPATLPLPEELEEG